MPASPLSIRLPLDSITGQLLPVGFNPGGESGQDIRAVGIIGDFSKTLGLTLAAIIAA